MTRARARRSSPAFSSRCRSSTSCRRASPSALNTCSERIAIGGVTLELERPADPEALLDEEAFGDDEFMPYWAELWPAGLALAEALPADLGGVRVVELGCGL